MWIAVGITSFEDCPMFTWSFGWTPPFAPGASWRTWFARFAITSFAFMFVDVPLPVWKMSRGNWGSWVPAITSSDAWTIAWASRGSSRPSS